MLQIGKETLLIVAPHPDDEVLGCGGLIQKIKEKGGSVYVLFLTVGETKEYAKPGGSVSNGNQRMAEIEKVAKHLQYDDYKIIFPGDTFHLRLDNIPQKDLITEIESGERISLNKIKPTIVATPMPDDYNQDHRACTEAIFTATRPTPNELKPFQPIIIGYESVVTADWYKGTSKHVNFFVQLSDKELEAKIQALKLYRSQVRPGSHPRSLQSLRTLAYFRGMYCGIKAAEAYSLFRMFL